MRRALTALAALAAASLAPAAVAQAETRTATAEQGAVRAELTWDDDPEATTPPLLAIARDGVRTEHAPANCPGDEGALLCELPLPGRDAVAVSDLDADGEPEVVVQLYSGGAHCCFATRVYWWDAANATYVSVRRESQDAAFRLRDPDRDGRRELVGSDARFAYRFGGYGESRFPVQVLRHAQGELSDVTREYPGLLRADVRRHLRTYRRFRRQGSDVEGVLAAYMADKARLGEAAAGWRVVRAAMRRDELKPGGERYVRRLRRLLRRWGYLPARKAARR